MMDTQIRAEEIIRALRLHEVEPDEDFTADAGSDYGYVAAWEIDERGTYAIAYGDNGTTQYDITDDADDLASWLLTDGTGADAVEIANVRGSNSIAEADPTTTEQCRIIEQHDYNGPTSKYNWMRDDNGNEIEATYDECKKITDGEDNDIYTLSYNESGRPKYYIVEA